MRLVTLYIQAFLFVLRCFSILSLSYSWTDTCPLTTKMFFDYASQNFSVVINDL